MFVNSRALDSFDQYLYDVEKYPLIEEAQEERELARRARAGDKEAAERLVTANLRFVISYVKKYQGRGLGPGRAGLHRQRRPAEGGQEVRSGQGRQVHFLRRLVDPPDGPAGAGRADALGSHPAEPEFEPGQAVADGNGADAAAGPFADRPGNRGRDGASRSRLSARFAASPHPSFRSTRRSIVATATVHHSASDLPVPKPKTLRRRSSRRLSASSSIACSRST